MSDSDSETIQVDDITIDEEDILVEPDLEQVSGQPGAAQRVIDIKPRSTWIKKVQYDPHLSFVQQVQENEDKKGFGIGIADGRFSQLHIHNMILTFYTEEIPY